MISKFKNTTTFAITNKCKNKISLAILFCALLSISNIAPLIAQNGNGNNGNNGNGTNWLPNNGNVGVGTLQPNFKLEVIGNSKFTDKASFDKYVVINDSLNVAKTLKVDGSATFKENLKVDKELSARTLYVFKIRPLPGDSLIHFGDSSIVLQAPSNPNSNGIHRIYAQTPSAGEVGFAFGRDALANQKIPSYAIGKYVTAKELHSIVIGSGSEDGSQTLYNDKPLSIMLGSNSPKPSVFINQGTADVAGFVGINNTEPGAEFDVNGQVKIRSLAHTGANKKVFVDASGMLRLNGSDPTPWEINGNTNTNPNSNWIGTNNAEGLSIRTNGKEAIYINVSDRGKKAYNQVIITNEGYSNPRYAPEDYIFAVNGKAIMEECEVRLKAGGSWPDYVFNKDYKLKTIEEQKEFIQKNKHLPGFKTAKEIETKESFGLGETQRLQQEKIEELFLYVIQLKEQNDALKKQVEQLRSK